MSEEILCEIEDEILVKLNGAILRKAEMEKDFEKVYTRVFEHIVKMEAFGFVDIVEIFGDFGG
ncbi:MAG: hypothetical protein QW040_02860 [Candidatus Aenigmatarchaeota archaeon]